MKEQPEAIWVVVRVESGVPVDVEAFRDQRSAERCERLWREDINPDDDDIGLFEVEIR